MTVIRAITDADIDAVAKIHVRTWRSAYAGIVPAEVLAALDPEVWAARRRSMAVPPDDDGRIGGFISFGPSRAGDGAGELYAIYVDPADQGRGLGQLLFDAARSGLSASGLPAMRLWVLVENHPARRFYERQGMAPDGATDYYTPRGSTVELPEMRYSVPL
jgi:ribosomal protein S18 acetylase RimI-like enzyme